MDLRLENIEEVTPHGVTTIQHVIDGLFLASAAAAVSLIAAKIFIVHDLNIAAWGGCGDAVNALAANSGFTAIRLGLDHPHWKALFSQYSATRNYLPRRAAYAAGQGFRCFGIAAE